MNGWMCCVLVIGISACAGHPRPLERAVPSAVINDATFALASASTVGGKAFDGWTPGGVAFVIVYAEEQWLFRSDGPLAGYDPLPFTSELGPVYRAPSWTRYDGQRFPNSPPKFFAHTDLFDGKVAFTIAAPSVSPFPASDWATIFVHEYFHSFQMMDDRWLVDAPLLSGARRQQLTELYLRDEAVRATVSRELDVYDTLLQALDHGTRPDCGALPKLLNARSQRAELLSKVDPVLPQAEHAFERMEGIARYVEQRAYDADEFAELVRTREREWKGEPAEVQRRRGLSVSKDGEYYYATGYALTRLLEVCNPAWEEELSGRDLLELVDGRGLIVPADPQSLR